MPRNQATVAVVLVNWNGWQHTIEACEALREQRNSGLRIIVVDNASTDGSVDHLRSALPETEIILNFQNLGFAGGCNVGIDRALSLGVDYVFLLNNDALVTSGTITELVAASERLSNNAILGSVLKFIPSEHYQFFGSYSTRRLGQPKWFVSSDDSHLLRRPLIETDFVIGAALFVPAKIFDIIGRFDERFFLTYEDVDLCYRARQHGVRCAIVPASTVYHHGSASMGPETGPLQTYFLTRNQLLFTKKHANISQRVGMHFSKFGRLSKLVLESCLTGKLFSASMKAMFLGLRDYGLGRFGDCPQSVRRDAER